MTRGIAEIEGARIYYEIEGGGPPVVFVNPGALDCRIWAGDRHRVSTRAFSRISSPKERHARPSLTSRAFCFFGSSPAAALRLPPPIPGGSSFSAGVL
jgi:hypothetical protein